MMFKTAFDLSTEKVDYFKTPFLIFSYLAFIIGIGLIISYKRNRIDDIKKVKTLFIGTGFISMAAIFLLLFLGGQFGDIHVAKKIMHSGKFSVVEGQPQHYHPMPPEGHDEESFDINGIHFAYSDYSLNGAGYNNAASLGGVIVPGKYYRLTYYTLHDHDIDSNRILKIEIRQ